MQAVGGLWYFVSVTVVHVFHHSTFLFRLIGLAALTAEPHGTASGSGGSRRPLLDVSIVTVIRHLHEGTMVTECSRCQKGLEALQRYRARL